ncbi:MAG: hypothetical protein ACYC3V_06305 [Chloroflexota bacterium]
MKEGQETSRERGQAPTLAEAFSSIRRRFMEEGFKDLGNLDEDHGVAVSVNHPLLLHHCRGYYLIGLVLGLLDCLHDLPLARLPSTALFKDVYA